MEQQSNYATYELCLTSEFVDVADTLASGWVFRGQEDASWDIKSSLEREAQRLGNTDLAAFEANALKHIKLAPHFGEPSNIQPEDDFSWLALLQHHGGKTRLVDFSRSFYVALYFAVRDCPDSDAAVWALATAGMDAKMATLDQQTNYTLSEADVPRRLVNNAIALPDRYKGDGNLAIVYADPSNLNRRMIAQQGQFLCGLNLETSFMDSLVNGLGLIDKSEMACRLEKLDDIKQESSDGKIIKICVPKSQHRNILFHLRRMNLTEATLFPGLDGFARSLNYFAMGGE